MASIDNAVDMIDQLYSNDEHHLTESEDEQDVHTSDSEHEEDRIELIFSGSGMNNFTVSNQPKIPWYGEITAERQSNSWISLMRMFKGGLFFSSTYFIPTDFYDLRIMNEGNAEWKFYAPVDMFPPYSIKNLLELSMTEDDNFKIANGFYFKKTNVRLKSLNRIGFITAGELTMVHELVFTLNTNAADFSDVENPRRIYKAHIMQSQPDVIAFLCRMNLQQPTPELITECARLLGRPVYNNQILNVKLSNIYTKGRTLMPVPVLGSRFVHTTGNLQCPVESFMFVKYVKFELIDNAISVKRIRIN